MILIRKCYNKKDEDKKDLYKEGAIAGGLALGAHLGKIPLNQVNDAIRTGKKSWVNGETAGEDKEFLDRYKKSKLRKPHEQVYLDQPHAAAAHNRVANGKASVHLGPNSAREIIAHELGHGKDFLENGHKPKWLPRLLNSGINIGNREINAGHVSMGAGAVAGLRAGAKKADDDDYKEETLSKYSGALTGAAIGAPTLAEEFRASRNGLKIMKELGYDKKAIRKGRKNLLKAGMSYGSTVMGNMAKGQAVHAISKKGAEWVLKDKDKKKKEEK